MKTFQMVENVKIYGGFPATGIPVFLDRDCETYVTTLSGNLGDDGYCYNIFYLDNGLGLTRNALLDDFTITNGVADNFSEGFDVRPY